MDEPRVRLNQIAVIGNYLPRQCGIATFTTDLCEALAATYPIPCFAVAINDIDRGYAYPPRVRFEIPQHDIAAYYRSADFLNISNVDIACLQHEYGIFGGPAGSHILALIRELRMPIVTTMHTVLHNPDQNQRRILQELAELSDLVIVMSQRGAEFLQDIYNVSSDKIEIIPHGIPDMPFVDPNFYKDRFGVAGKIVLLTFGLISPNKGIEYVIESLPLVLEHYPNVVYIVLGATHPYVRRQEGESYRSMLQNLARECGVERNVIFFNRFVSLEELVEFIGAADIYITPYLSREQIVSGTLSYSLGAGKAVISTPYWYAEEMLANGRGMLVPFRDAKAIAEKVLFLLDNEAERHAMRKRAYLYTRDMVWQKVAQRYMEAFHRARLQRMRSPRPAFVAKALDKRHDELPLIKLDHLRHLTDSTGILQHAVFSVANYAQGYTTDDNARALVVAVLLEELGMEGASEAFHLASRYLAFLWHAFNFENGRFRNFLSYERRWMEEVGSEDSHGRALWALGTLLGRINRPSLHGPAGRLFDLALPAVLGFTSPRAYAFVLIGIQEYSRRFPGDRAAQHIRQVLAERLIDLYRQHSEPDWHWFEPILAYDNGKMSHALISVGHALAQEEMLAVGLTTLEWLTKVQRSEAGYFVPIGTNGFYKKGGERARFDQQPIEAQAMISACLEAYRITKEERWYHEAQRAFQWFLGRNDLRLPLYDPTTGGCRDGLQPDRVNQNQGAESTLAFLLSLLEMRLAENALNTNKEA